MKHLLVMRLVLLLGIALFGFIACGNDDDDDGAGPYDCSDIEGNTCAMSWCSAQTEQQGWMDLCEGDPPPDNCDQQITCYDEYLTCVATDCTEETATDVTSACAIDFTECTST